MTRDGLERMRLLMQAAAYGESKMKRLRDDAERTTHLLDTLPHRTDHNSSFEERLIEMLSVQTELTDIYKELGMLRSEFDQTVAELDWTQKLLMILRYLDGLSWNRIAELMKTSPSHVFNLHRRALGHFPKNDGKNH